MKARTWTAGIVGLGASIVGLTLWYLPAQGGEESFPGPDFADSVATSELRDPDKALEELQRIDGTCRSFRVLFANSLVAIRESDPAWLDQFLSTITIERIAGERLDAFGLRLVGDLATGGMEELDALVDECALGAGGAATREQMTDAILFAFLRREDASDRFLFLQQVRASPHLAARPRSAGLLSGLILHPDSWPDDRPEDCVAVVREMLADPQIGVDVAPPFRSLPSVPGFLP